MRSRHRGGRSCKFGSGTSSRIATGTVISASTCACQDGERCAFEHPSGRINSLLLTTRPFRNTSAPRGKHVRPRRDRSGMFACFITAAPRSSASIRRHNHGGAERLTAMCEKHADKPVALMEARHVRALRDERSDQPGAANTRLKALKALFAWACEEKPESRPQNPTLGVRKIKYATDGHHSWTPERDHAISRSTPDRQQGTPRARSAALHGRPS